MKDCFESAAQPARTLENARRINEIMVRLFMGAPLCFLRVYGQSIRQKVSIYELPVSAIAAGQGGNVYGDGV